MFIRNVFECQYTCIFMMCTYFVDYYVNLVIIVYIKSAYICTEIYYSITILNFMIMMLLFMLNSFLLN